ncbi:MAG: GNAT family N-acetyltransferase [Burkholderiaceae bacterium]|nr:GNAT family N-acetyltransferase [Microbacteriaceae bacterium]
MTTHAPFARKPTLAGDRVILRPFETTDIDAMGPVLADPEVLILTGSVHTSAEAHGRSADLDAATREWYETRAAQSDRLDLAIIDRESSACVGEVVLNELHVENDSCNFRILIGPAGRDRGLGTEATRLILDHAFATTQLNRIGLEVFAFNPRAQRMYRGAGFALEGTRRAAHRFDGAYVDAVIMAIIRSDAVSQHELPA